jgi:osmotically-inducible protein OsmY
MQLKTSLKYRNALALAGSLLVLSALGACGNPVDDEAAARHTEQAAAKAIAKSQAMTEKSIAYASGLMSNAAQQAQELGADAVIAAGKVVDDAVITTTVGAGIAKDPELSKIKIDVTTNEGVVTLSGAVPTADVKNKVAELARATAGVKSVDNQLQLKNS